jgi:hypothetical protein
MAIEKREELRREEERKAAEEQQRADDAALEEHRVCAWVNHRVDQAQAAADPNAALHELLLKDPKDVPAGWPPGRDPSEYKHVLAKAPAPTQASKRTALGQLLAAKGATI